MQSIRAHSTKSSLPSLRVTACAYAYMYALASYVHMGNAALRVIVRTCSIPITNTFADKEERSEACRKAKHGDFRGFATHREELRSELRKI